MNRIVAGGAICLITLLNWGQFPGHTYLQSDTQIYVPILEHLWDPSALRQDPLVQRPHVSFTLYDEAAQALRKITGRGFRQVLGIEQLACRALGIWGIYLMATAAGLSTWPALLVAAICSLGATIAGPAVLTFEYEPVPRGFAVPLLFLAIGLTAHGRDVAAGIAAAAAFLIHPPTVYPFWGIYFVLTLWPSKPAIMARRLYGLIPLLYAAVLLLIASRYQAGAGETQMFFTRLDALQERLQRMRASYVWISMWWRNWWSHYLLLYAATLIGYWRIRKKCPFDLRVFLVGLPIVGVLSMPLSYYLLEKQKWALIPQFQPMRALLFVAILAVFSAAAAGCGAAQERRWAEAIPWFLLAYLVPTNTRVLEFPSWNRAGLVILLAIAAFASIRFETRWKPWAMAAVAVAAFFLVPICGKVRNYPRLSNPELMQLAQWARTSTPKDAVFLFPDSNQQLQPGIFRAEALRAVYVDWKSGGQVNYLKELGEQWWARWQKAMTEPLDLLQYREMGIDYIVVRANHHLPDETPVFENSRFLVYNTR